MLKAIGKILGTKASRDVKGVTPYVALVNTEFEKLTTISDDQLRARTPEIKAQINKELAPIDTQIEAIKKRVEEDASLDIHQKEELYNQVDKLEEDRNTKLETVLTDVLPQAFAVVKETAKRLKENKQLSVSTTDHDRMIAEQREGVDINGSQTIWHNKWKAAGIEVEWDMVHYDVQIIGGVVLHQGKIAEMATGEGKTLVSTLPAYLNALAGRGVHLVTVNDYLARRDSEWMAPIFEFHGMRVDCIDKYQPHSDERKNAYMADITYGTNNEFGFDYLRDNMSSDTDELVQRKHHYAMVDEVDSVLVDDARTPLIISGPVPQGDDVHEYHELKPLISKLVDAQKKLCTDYLVEAKRLIKEGNEKDAGLPLFRAFRGLPKSKPLIKFMSEPGIQVLLQKVENEHLAENQKKMPEADEPLFFTIDEKSNQTELTEKGSDIITKQAGGDADYFILPDISTAIDSVEKDESLAAEKKIEKKEEIISDYKNKAQRLHAINQLLKAYTLFEKDKEYVVMNGKVMIVDEQTGRIMDGRRYSDGLHQSIEAKENVKVESASQTYATVTLQNYFRMYHKLCGMTGTAETEAGEFWEIYELDVVVIPTNRPIQRDDTQDKIYKTVREKFNAVIDEVGELTSAGRPVLVGTTSVEISELLSKMLNMRKIKHQVLNAKQHAKEADVVAEAGKPGTVTIATNMAGRGTDIKLTPESKSAGGLAIIGTERHESRRIDRQLRGRAGRQGDVGSSLFYVSLEDDLMRLFKSDRIAKVMDRLKFEEGEMLQHSMITKSIERAQKKVEENNFGIRKRLLEYDDVMNSQREVIYKKRKNALKGERLELDVLNMLYDLCENIVLTHKATTNFEGFELAVIANLAMDPGVSKEAFAKTKENELTGQLFDKALKQIERKNTAISENTLKAFKRIDKDRGAVIENVVIPLTDGTKQIRVVCNLGKGIKSEGKEMVTMTQKYAILAIIDHQWKEHLREMDDLKQSVQNATFEQKDPLLIYKFEGFELFKKLINNINEAVISFLMKCDIASDEPQQVQEARQQERVATQESKDQFPSAVGSGGSSSEQGEERERQAPVRSSKVYGRNDKVTVKYIDGSVKEEVKFKSVEQDVLNNRCLVIEA
ncbi:MAG: preprotein translocase subunit SecA [Cyclobacteriaceae bacterium]